MKKIFIILVFSLINYSYAGGSCADSFKKINSNQNSRGKTDEAIQKSNHRKMGELLIAYGSDLNIQDIKGNTPLHIAVAKGNLESVQILLEYGADVNIKDREGMTSLERAESLQRLYSRSRSRIKIVELLRASQEIH